MRALAIAGVAAGLLAFHAPAASADHVDADCGFNSISQQDVTGGVYEGVAFGYVVARDDTPAIRCAILVNGVEATTTPAGPATPTIAVTAGRVTFSASETDFVQICPVVTTQAHGERTYCPPWVHPQLPPQEVYDALEPVWDAVEDYADPVLCAALAEQSPGTPPVVIEEDGDLWVGAVWVWECPPYEW